MGYSKDYHFIFIRPEKTGGTSIDEYLHDNCKTYNIQANIHKSAFEYIKHLGEINFIKYFKFSVTRNPWERLFSLYNHWIRHYITNNERPDLHDFTNISTYKKWLTEKYSTKTTEQEQLHNHIIYKPICNFYINYNNLKQDLHKVCDIINIEKNNLNHLNNQVNRKTQIKTLNTKDYIYFYDYEAKEMVSKLCKIDIDYFGYTFTSGPNKNVSKILYPLETDKLV